ncbi:MAG: Xaa-Pro aminopeptidase [candidate division TM6 bacterium GW2011_GWE2_42_60]|nr:MAG: Xaa-Pro aminopeptidase [candidate division TM6 bacterium GW2011_GWE2_42_60]HBY05587.1 hypothetical protein [Candidatus Dependentiae bacterium]
MSLHKGVSFKERRMLLAQRIQKPILLWGAFEDPRCRFYQESSFFYFTGLSEPGLVCLIMPEGKSILFTPSYAQSRALWLGTSGEYNAEHLGFDEVCALGNPGTGYRLESSGPLGQWSGLIEKIRALLTSSSKIGVLSDTMFLWRLCQHIPHLEAAIFDISSVVAELRRCKDAHEMEALFRAGEETVLAQEAAALAIISGESESGVRASVEYTFIQRGVECAFPSIVAGGRRATILHYANAEHELKKDELVIVDIGASYGHYCGDVTRTYPVSGLFSPRHRAVYEIVLKAQEAAAESARPGYYIKNNADPEHSLHHIATAVLKEAGLDQFFTHGIGHFLGLDVHDVGDATQPLQIGDVITIEPGVYLPNENFGIRIEDDYWVVKNGVVSLTDHLPKTVSGIESFMAQLKAH